MYTPQPEKSKPILNKICVRLSEVGYPFNNLSNRRITVMLIFVSDYFNYWNPSVWSVRVYLSHNMLLVQTKKQKQH